MRKKKKVQGCVSQNSDLMKSVLRKAREIGIERFGGTHREILRTHLVRKLKFGKVRGNLEALSKKMNLMSEILARPVFWNEHLRKPHDKQIVPAKQCGIWREKYTSLKLRIKLRFILSWKKRLQKHRRSHVCRGFRSFNAHAEQGVWSSDQTDTLRRSRNLRAVLTATGEVQINEESQVFVHDLGLFVTVQLLDETPAVLSLRMLCSEHGCSY